jgi:hypothetical protein
MPIKSWAFRHHGHIIRAEIYWRLLGLNRKRAYVDHKRKLNLRGRFTAKRPLKIELEGAGEVLIRFRPRRFRTEMECEIASNGSAFSAVNNAFVDKAWRPYPGDGEPEKNMNPPMFLLVISVLLLLGVLFGPMAFVGGMIWSWQDRKLRRQLGKAGRRLNWQEVERRLSSRATPSTLILQSANLTPRRAWWTEDNILKKFPLPVPQMIEVINPSPEDHPFFEWLNFRYLAPETGKACITEIPPDLFGEFDIVEDKTRADLLHEKYPMLEMVHTGYARARPAVQKRMAELIGENLDESLPRLLEGTSDPDPATRRFCLKCLQLSGERASFALSQMTSRLYEGNDDERQLVARVLSNIGAAGLEVLQLAKMAGDPRIARSATSALHIAENNAKSVTIIRKPEQNQRKSPEERAGEKRRFRLQSVAFVALTVASLAAIFALCWFCGTLWTLTLFAICSTAAIGILIGWQYRKVQRRARLRMANSEHRKDEVGS